MKKKSNLYYLAAAVLFCLAVCSGLACGMSATVSDSQGASELNASAVAGVANLMAIQIIDKNSATRRVFSALGEGLQGEYTTSDCPNVTMNPPDIVPVPKLLTINVDWGGGCEQSPGHVVSGSVVAALTNIQFTDSIIAANYNVTANNVVDNGTQVANGNVSGYAQAVPAGGDALHLNADMNFSNFLIAGYVSNGNATFAATNVNLSDMTISAATVTLTNFNASGLFTAQNCVLNINQTGGNTYNVRITGTTSLGALDLEATVNSPSSNVYVFNTTRPGSMAGYTVEMNDLRMDLDRCGSNPISGTLTISGNGNTYGKTFSGACDGDWNIPGL